MKDGDLILVTGGAGYLGSVVVRMLLSEKYKVRVLDYFLHGSQSLLGINPTQNLDIIQGDIRSVAVIKKALRGVDAVVHLAAIVGDPACARQPQLAKEVNLYASLQLFELSQQQHIDRFIFASTCSNYGKTQDPSQYLTEESELRPVSLYAETKVAVEKVLLNSCRLNSLAVVVLRIATAFGLSPRMRFDLTVNEFTMELLTKRKLVIYGERFWRPYVHVQDIARVINLALNAPLEKIDGQVYNVGDTTQNYKKKELVNLILAQIGDGAKVEYIQKEEDPRDYRVSFEKIKQKLGFEISHTVEDGIREVIEALNKGMFSDLADPRYRN